MLPAVARVWREVSRHHSHGRRVADRPEQERGRLIDGLPCGLLADQTRPEASFEPRAR